MPRLRIGCGAGLLLTAAAGLVGYSFAALLTVIAGAQALEIALLVGAGSFLLASGGAVLVWSGLPQDQAAARIPAPSSHPLTWLVRFGLVLLAGQLVLAVAAPAAGLILPPLHFLAGLLPAMAVTAPIGLRPRLMGLTYGGCGAATIALAIEALVAGLFGATVYAVLNTSAQGRAALDAAWRAFDAAETTGELDPAAFSDLLTQPLAALAIVVLIGFAGPLIEELVKAAGVAVASPTSRGQAWWWGVAIGAGFGLTEAVMLGAMGVSAWSIAMFIRAGATLMHATMTGVAGLGLFLIIAERRRLRGAGLVAVAAAGHMAWNILVILSAISGLGLVAEAAAGQRAVMALAGPGLAALMTTIAVGYVVGATRYRADGPWYTAAPRRDGGTGMTPFEYARSQQKASEERLMDFLKIPCISAVPERSSDMLSAAEWVAERLRGAGATGVRIDNTDGHPVVYGESIGAPGAPTVLVYGHYDVQPPDPLELWTTPPFEPTVRDGEVFARGASDDKGQVLIHLEALAAFTATAGGPPINLKYVIEGEEEIGSPNLEGWLREHADDLRADIAVISDTAMTAPDQPSIVYGLRGLAYLEVEIAGPNRDLHSGQFGGAVLNPAHALASIVASLHEKNGRVAIPGFYDKVVPLTADERELMAEVPFDMDAFGRAAGLAGDWGEEGYSLVERLGARPTLDVNGIWSGWTGAGAKTVLPAKAHAKISMRLVPDQDPEEITRLCSEHIRRLAPEGTTVTISPLHGAKPAVVDRDTPAVRAAARGYEMAFGNPPVFTREGGTIPVVASLQDVLGLPSVLMGFGLPDDNLHAPNEKFRLSNFNRGIEAVIGFIEALSVGPS